MPLQIAAPGAGAPAPRESAASLDAGDAGARASDPAAPVLADAGKPPLAGADKAKPDAEPAASSRDVLVGQVENARDLGGITLAPGARVKARKLLRGPPLVDLSESGCGEVAKLGIRSVIDLRVDSEASLLPDQACALAANQTQLVAAPLPVPYNVSAADYIAVLDARESIVKVFETLADEARYPVYFHCTWGRDRTGILAALILLALGASPDAVMEDYLESRKTVGAYPASLEATLEEITRRGGIDAYLAATGVSDQQLKALRAQAVER